MREQEIDCPFLLPAGFDPGQQGRVIEHGGKIEQALEPLPRLVRIFGMVDLASQCAKRLVELAAEALAAGEPVCA